MFGPDGFLGKKGKKAKSLGVIPRAIDEMFFEINERKLPCTVYCSFLQIYNEKILDLLVGNLLAKPLKIREDKH